MLKQWQAPGDVLVFTAAVRDFKQTFPHIKVGVCTPYPFLWENNPYIDKILDLSAKTVAVGYSTPSADKTAKSHFIYAFHRSLERLFDVKIKRGACFPDIWLSNDDIFGEIKQNKPILLINAGSKPDFPIKQWPLDHFQAVADACSSKFTVVQIGSTLGTTHKPLKNVINLINNTPGRRIVALMRAATAVVSGVSFPMHLWAAVNHADQGDRKCVVVAGNRENPWWERYAGCDYLSAGCSCTNVNEGCWKRYLPPDYNDRTNLCMAPIRLTDSHYYASCVGNISPESVIKCLL